MGLSHCQQYVSQSSDHSSSCRFPSILTFISLLDDYWSLITTTLIDGVYRSGFATTQEAYESAVKALFESLDKIESIFKAQAEKAGGRSILRPPFPVPNSLSLINKLYYNTVNKR